MMKTKRLYQSPQTRRDVVELEDGFCGSIMGSSEAAKTSEHLTGFDDSDGDTFTQTEWQ